MKYEVIKKNRSRYPVKKMCRILKVSGSGFHKWLKRGGDPSLSDAAALKVHIKTIHKKSRETYGYLRITKALRSMGFVINKKRVARLMQQMGISGLQIKRFRPKTTLSEHNYPIAVNLLNRNFQLKEKNKVWVSDITYIEVNNTWAYLCTVMDLGSREIVGWSLENHMRVELVLKATQSALKRRGLENVKELIFHSDRGSQYASNTFQKYLKDIGARPSMSGKGNCYDNAVSESFFATLKREEVNRKKYNNIKEARISLFAYIEIFYNRQRAHSSIGYKVPMEVAS